MSASDLMNLYSTRILALAADIPHTDVLKNPDVTVKRRAPSCGSTVQVNITAENGVITGFSQDVKACALGQAAASVGGRAVVGADFETIRLARDTMRAFLNDDGPAPAAPFDELEVLAAARDFKNRHDSIMLMLDATCDAIDELTGV